MLKFLFFDNWGYETVEGFPERTRFRKCRQQTGCYYEVLAGRHFRNRSPA